MLIFFLHVNLEDLPFTIIIGNRVQLAVAAAWRSAWAEAMPFGRSQYEDLDAEERDRRDICGCRR